MSDTLFGALDSLVPPVPAGRGDWDDVLARAGVRPPAAAPAPAGRRWTRRRLSVVAVALVLLAALAASPALGHLLRSLFGRSDVPFTGQRAPLPVRRQFADLSLGAPAGMDPQAIPGETRKVATFRVDGHPHVLWVAPTRGGGFCHMFTHMFGGCRQTLTPPVGVPIDPASFNPFLIGVTERGSVGGETDLVGGDILADNAARLTVTYADGTTGDIPFVFVGPPIDAGFFLYSIPAAHDTHEGRALTLVLEDADGKLISRAPLRGSRPRVVHPRTTPVHSPPPPQHPPPPAAPLQRGADHGVTVEAGHNGVAVFNTDGADPVTRRVLGAGDDDFACFRFDALHPIEPRGLGAYQALRPEVAVKLEGLSTPFDGCEVRGSIGRPWPDPYGSHSPVEIAFTPAARRYFADRAAARDLAGFVRSRKIQKIRRLHGQSLERALAAYAPHVARGNTSPGTIGYRIVANGATFVEASTTGKRFFVTISDGRVARTNVRDLAFVF